MELVLFLIIGALAGFSAGLFGVGGGTIIVPLLFIVFTQMNYRPDVVMHMALGTSLATIIVTSISSLMAHHKKGAVVWPIFKNLAPTMAVGCFIGAGIAGWMSGIQLQLIVGSFLLWVSWNMYRGAKRADIPTKPLPSPAKQMAAGSVIGIASAIFGIGGGSITVPYLTRYGVVMQKAVGTSAACGLPIAIAGALGFMLLGRKAKVDIPNTTGFIHTYAFIGISIMSFFTAKLGARVAHTLSPAMLKKCFSGLLCLVSFYFIFKGIIALHHGPAL